MIRVSSYFVSYEVELYNDFILILVMQYLLLIDLLVIK